MSGLLDEVLAAHGGRERWQQATSITAKGTFGGLLSARFPENKMTEVNIRVELAEQHAVFSDFPATGQRAVFDRGDVRIETTDGASIAHRHDPRRCFTGRSGLRRNLRWDALDATYFAGYAWWNYLTTPLLLTRDDVLVTEPEAPPTRDRRRLEVHFPEHLHTHSQRQTFYVDPDGLIRRHDYVAEPVGRWAAAAHHSDEHRAFDGLVFPTRRRVCPRGPGGRSLGQPTLVALDIDALEIAS